jgi:molybdopterin-guanine dinucleotide biosynthesis protein A
MTSPEAHTFGLVLAGGRSSRMGGVPKPFLDVGGQTLMERGAARLAAQCASLAVSGPPACELLAAGCQKHGLTLIRDREAYLGPVAGLLAGLDHCAEHHPAIRFLASVPVDTPFLPDDLISRLHAGRLAAGAAGAMAQAQGVNHPVVALWPVACRHLLRARLSAGIRRAGDLAREAGLAPVSMDDCGPDAFLNINTRHDLDEARRLLGHAATGPLVPDARRV